MKKEWFEEWFDASYYHLLYNRHDEQEARRTMDNLLAVLNLDSGARILDLACGKGRHARYLAECGYDVTGLDISWNSISEARKYENERLAFFQHDMRKLFRTNYFDAVLNMFTSFGYFSKEADHLHTVQNAAKALKPGGLLFIDFLNAHSVRRNLVASEVKEVEGITFHLHRSIEGGFVFKTIAFEAEGKQYRFRESVRLFELPDFESLFAQAGLTLLRTFGDYDMSAFEPTQSKRLMLLAQKQA